MANTRLIYQAADLLEREYQITGRDKKNLNTLFEAYQRPRNSETQITDQQTAAAYVIARGLSIAGVIQKILRENQPYLSDVKSVADFGGGPGTFLFEALEHLEIMNYSNIDLNRPLTTIFKQLAKEFASTVKTSLHLQDYTQFSSNTNFDLGVLCYTLCENDSPMDVVRNAHKICDQLLIIEPGTPDGFNTILKARELLQRKGFAILAPCTTNGPCPLQDHDSDWCHSIVRLERTRLQMILKNAQIGYEDEKYAYLLASKEGSQNTEQVRIISKPKASPTHGELFFCGDKEYKHNRIFATKKTYKKTYKAIKKSKRGDLISLTMDTQNLRT